MGPHQFSTARRRPWLSGPGSAAGLSEGSVRAVVGLASAVALWVSAYHVAVRG